MRIDLTCPVELWHYALPTRQYPVCRLQLFNLTEQTVVSVQAVFSCYDGGGSLISRQVERAQGLHGEGRSAFEMAVMIEDGADAAGMDFSIEKVWFEDGTVWRHTANHVSEYTPNPLADARRLEVLRYLAGPDALGYPSDQGAVWMCVCGRPNAAGEDTCRRCGRLKRDVFTSFNEATVETVIFEHENAMEEKARRERAQAQKQAEEEAARKLKNRRRRRRILGSVLTVLILAVLAFGVYFHGVPYYRFYTAQQQLENGVYTTARAEFEKLAVHQGERSLPVKIDFLNLDFDLFDMKLYYESETLAKECTYRQAAETMATGTIPALRTAQDTFDGLADYKDSATQAQEARYQRANLLLAARQYENAIALYDEIPAYRDGAALRQSAVYQWAVQMMDRFDYAGAREKFLSLGNYEDAARRAKLCLYQPAMAALEGGEYLRAIELLTQLDAGFESTAVRLQEAYYGAGNDCFAAQDYDTAAEYYLLAGDYRDAYSQATACLYEPACALFDAGNYAQAKEMFDKILAFRDSQVKSWQCSEALGRAAMEREEYENARMLLSGAREYEPADELYKESIYIPAIALQEAGDIDGAQALLEDIAGYADVDERLNEIAYDKAIALMNAHEYEQAMAAFEALGEYRESAAELLNARYGYALQLMENGRYEEAIAQLEQLNGYLSSARYIDQAYFELGTLALNAGDYADAAQKFLLAGDYADAYEQYQACVYHQAENALNKGEDDQAAAFLALIPDYADADDLRRQSVYSTAEARQEAGALAEAAGLFASISGYQDADARAAACYDAYYAEAYNTAKAAMGTGDYPLAIASLESVSRENPGSAYSDIEDMYREASYKYANQLYDEKKPYEALAYYRRIPDYRDVEKKLDRVCYRILGKWVSRTGIKMEFRDDGTCTIDGRDYCFYAATYAFYLGDRPEELTAEWKIHRCTSDHLSIENVKAKAQYSLTPDKGEQ